MNTIIKTEKSFLNVYKDSSEEYNDLMELCIAEIMDKLLENPKINIYGKSAIQHRSIGFFSNDSIGYYYSGQLAKSQSLSDNLSILLDKINTKFDSKFNGILVNKYNDGNDYIGAHSDDETALDKCGVVCISYGAVRKFRIKNKITKKTVVDIPTISNNILHMGGDFQKEFTHEIPIEKKIKNVRYSFTFRKHNK
jgi:alkylated DNA repair dioxygenase AlkB